MELKNRLVAWKNPATAAPTSPSSSAAASPAPSAPASATLATDTWRPSAAAAPSPSGLSFEEAQRRIQQLASPAPAQPEAKKPEAADKPEEAKKPEEKKGGSGPRLDPGAWGDPVKKLQERLAELGFDPQGADGALGPNTQAAIRAFQQANNLEADGIVGPDTWNALGVSVEGLVQGNGSGPRLDPGVSGEPVKKLQERLAEFGFDPQGADGAFGPNTEAAVRAFQQANNLEVDGIVGPDTWNALGITVTGSVSGASATTAPAGADGEARQTEDGPMVSRQGYLISPQIADSFDRMVADASKSGVTLRINSAYRSSAEQAVLYAQYQAGEGPIAAPPGSSMHNKGLAIDFANEPGAYDWLKSNATNYGLHNFDPEPWHYSTTGG